MKRSVARFRRPRLAQTKTAIQHSRTNVQNTGAGTVDSSTVLQTSGGARSTGGATTAITDDRTTGERVNVGDIVKYLNIFIQCSPRTDIDLESDRTGWLEYALVMVKQSEGVVPITNLGLQTLGDVTTKMFRNECIWTGNFPVGTNQPNSISLHIKVPKFKQKIRLGDDWRLVTYFRAFSSTSVSTVAVRLIASYIYKAYQ